MASTLDPRRTRCGHSEELQRIAAQKARIAQLERDCAGSPAIGVSRHNLGLMIAQMVLRGMDCP
jgi:hypothetical protein